METHDSPSMYGPLYGAAMLDLLGGPKIIWPSTIYADDTVTELPIWEQETTILSPMVLLSVPDAQPDFTFADRDTAPFRGACLPPRATAFSLPRFVANWWTHRASD
ncbi:MAG: hypothetical protein ACRDHE_07950 [Ktedonobacterales bacterium]